MVYLTQEDVDRGVVMPEEMAPDYSSMEPVPIAWWMVDVPSILGRVLPPSEEEVDVRDVDELVDRVFWVDDHGKEEEVYRFARSLMSLPPGERFRILDTLNRLSDAVFQNSYAGGVPIYVQGPEGDDEDGFIMQFSDSLLPEDDSVFVNFQMGIAYVFARRMFLQTG